MENLIFLPYKNQQIKNIIFDLGGVILNIDYNLTLTEFKKLGFNNLDSLFTQANQIELFDNLDKGLISPADFRNTIRELSGIALTDAEIDLAWNAMLLDYPLNRLKLLEKIKHQYRTFLLSNTNKIHCEVYNKELKNIYGGKDLSFFFEKLYYSHEIHMRKPNREVFELILNENNLDPKETLFIDDTEQHIVGAKALGIKTFHLNLKEGEAIEHLFA